ncbi:transposase [Piscinibacter aquaticus]|uniref:Transposase n=1 Tax=Piscinibacter aquaticus TaxID=392597 RepID=A0A5C6TPG3_9BURK|nr:transposase [Piscinibacter aquaticus]
MKACKGRGYVVKRNEFIELEIAFALKQNELGTAVEEVCRKMDISEVMFCVWKRTYSGSGRPNCDGCARSKRRQPAQANRRGSAPRQGDAAGCRRTRV